MAQLSYKTRKDVSIYGIPKVYFCCHPQDFDGCFEEISDELLGRQNCSVWYRGREAADYSPEFFEDLSQMHLFVVPVTGRFLQEGNPALEVEFRFASENHIPILPLMQESGLEQSFNHLCGNLQFLDKFNHDATCIEYSEKLDKFLDSVLLGDELIQKIRDAFDAYIFLSYRKKDRKHAQKLMQLVHKNDFCRDIAIWYDEFLVPGEDFNQAITEAMKKSKLFLLAVTPNLVNEVNYIMNVEFPMAISQGKPVLPCEMVATDRTMLEQKYARIPACATGNEELAERLRTHFLDIATRERNSTPEHLYFMGLAYLNGIDVEVNREYALKLITDAAEQNLMVAIEQLINMYANGIGVTIDAQKQLQWHAKRLEVAKQKYEQDKNYDNALLCLGAMLTLAQTEYDMDFYDEAVADCNEAKMFSDSVLRNAICLLCLENMNIQRHIAQADVLLGQICHAQNDFVGAATYYQQAETVLEQLNDRLEDPLLLRDTAMLHIHMAQLCKVAADYAGALRNYEKALKLQRRNATEFFEYHLDQVMTLIRISEIKRLIWDCAGAKQCCETALQILKEQIGSRNTRQYMAIQILVILGMAESCRTLGELDEALDHYKMLTRLENLYMEQYGDFIQGVRAKRLGKTAQIYYMMGDCQRTIQYGTQALELLSETELLNGSNIASGGTEAMTLHLLVGVSYFRTGNEFDNSCRHIKNAVRLADDNMQRGIRCNLPDVVLIYSTYCDMLQIAGNQTEATTYLQKAIKLYEEHLSGDDNFRNVGSGMGLYIAMGKSYMLQEKLDDAIAMFKKAEVLYQKCAFQASDGEELLQRDDAALAYLLASCYAGQGNPCAKEYYQKCMDIYDRIPDTEYNLTDYNIVGVAVYQLYNMSGRFLKSKKLKKRLLDVASLVKTRFPNEYRELFFYELLQDTGIFD